jgi:hypothetical protein
MYHLLHILIDCIRRSLQNTVKVQDLHTHHVRIQPLSGVIKQLTALLLHAVFYLASFSQPCTDTIVDRSHGMGSLTRKK